MDITPAYASITRTLHMCAGTPAEQAMAEELCHLTQQGCLVEGPMKAALEAKHGADWSNVGARSRMCRDMGKGLPASAQLKHLAEWAAAAVERCAVAGPCGGPDQALLPLVCALPKVPAGVCSTL